MEKLTSITQADGKFDSKGFNQIPDFSFPDLVDIEDLQQLITLLHELTETAIGILDNHQNFFAKAGFQKICNNFHRIHPDTCGHCIESDNFIEQHLKTQTPITYKCRNGMWDIGYPVFIENKHVANIVVGQFFFDDEEIDIPFFELQARKYGFDKNEYINSLMQVPRISRKKAETIKHFMSLLAHMLTTTGYANLRLKKEKIEELKIANQQLRVNEQKLRELNSTKDKFFSIIAHDLKNPFTVLCTGSELLAKYLEKNDIPKSLAKAEMISNASKKGYALLENLLTWAQSQTGGIGFNPEKINFRKKVAKCMTEMDEQARNKQIKLINEIPEDLEIEADKNILAVILRNLIANAIKFTHTGGSVTLKAKTHPHLVEISVIDTGIGIPKEHQHKLFKIDENYSRVGTAKEASTSLGLILCKEFIEKHNGTIWVESEEHKGSEFRFTLPYSQN